MVRVLDHFVDWLAWPIVLASCPDWHRAVHGKRRPLDQQLQRLGDVQLEEVSHEIEVDCRRDLGCRIYLSFGGSTRKQSQRFLECSCLLFMVKRGG